MAIQIYAESGKINHIGRVGENLATTVIFDVSDQIDNFGSGGNFTLLIQQNGILNTENLTYTNKQVEWYVTDAYTSLAGQGRVQIVYKKGDIISKSEIYKIMVTIAVEEEEGDE